MRASLLHLWHRYLSRALLDALVIAVSLLLAWTVRAATTDLEAGPVLGFGLLAIAVQWSVNYFATLYHRLWRYASAAEVVVIAEAATVGTALLLVGDLLWPGVRPVPLSVVLLMGFFAFVGLTGVRYRGRMWSSVAWHRQSAATRPPAQRTRVLIIGAGEAGQLLAWRFLQAAQGQQYQLVGFIDDDPAKIGMRLHGLPVLGDRWAIPSVVASRQIDLLIIAIYHLSEQDFRDILAICERSNARVKVLPDVFEFIRDTQGLPLIRDVTLQDLLGRQPVQVDQQACSRLLAGKTVLVTGAAGSIGSELCRQVLRFKPKALLMLDNNESGLFDLELSLELDNAAHAARCIVGDVTNWSKMRAVFEQHRPEIVFHAAAYKHVPLMEDYPDEAVRVNILGTQNVAELACRYRAERFVFVSTDKAVSPTSVMGATKRVGEMLVSCLAGRSPTLCAAVRFGNVLGSRGSVIPTFERQIAAGGPITITHPEMTRYFMSISEAVSLVIQAAALTRGGDLFVLDMGEQIRIEELALRLIRLRGLRPQVDIPITCTGVRPGEKLHEQLTEDGEITRPTAHPDVLEVQGAYRPDSDLLRAQITELAHLAQEQRNEDIGAKLWQITARRAPESLVLQGKELS